MQDSYLLSFVLILARVAAFIGFLPIFGRQQVPTMIKVGLATALTFFWFGSVPLTDVSDGIPALLAILLITKEIGIGILLALFMGLILVPVRIAGAYVGQEIGISMEPVTQTDDGQSTILTAIFESFAIMLFFILNLHHFLFLVLHHSMTDLAGKISLLNLPTEAFVNWIDNLFEYAMLIAAPIGVLCFASLIALFFLSKAAPSMNLFSVGMPLRIGLGILALFAFIPVLWRSIEVYFRRTLIDIEQLLNYFWLANG